MNTQIINSNSVYDNITKNKKVAVWGWWQGKNLGDMWILESIKRKFPGIIPITTEEEDFTKYDFLIVGGGGLLNGPKLRAPFDSKLPIKYGAFGLGGEFHIKDKETLKKFINLSVFFGIRDTRNLETYAVVNNRRMEISGDCTFMYPLKRMNPNKGIKMIKLIWRDPHGLLRWDKSKHHKEDGIILNKLFKGHLGDVPFNDNQECLKLYMNILKNRGTVIFDHYRVSNFTTNPMYSRFRSIDLIRM
jgi:hypothetical protein